jgi:uncharacterized RDD family membrane protein YckC
MKRPLVYCLVILASVLSRAQDAATQDPAPADPPEIPFKFTSSSGKDRVAVGGSVHVKEDEVVKDVVVVVGSAIIDGKVTGDFVVVLGNAKLGPKAHLSRDLTVVMGSLDADPNAVIKGEQHIVAPTQFTVPNSLKWVPQWFHKGLLLGRPLPHQYAWAWIVSAIFIALYLLIALLFPGPVRASVNVLQTRPGTSLLTGLLGLLLVGPLLVLLLVTVIGSILIPFLICGGVAAYFFGKVVVYAYAGRQIFGDRVTLLLPVLVGAILFTLLYAVPVLGFLVWGVAAPLGLGAVLLAFFGRLRKEEPKPPIGEPPPPALGATPTTAPAPALSSMTALSPRAGFWLRFLGTLVDLIVIGTICKIFEIRPPGLILAWTVYHIVMWALKGATIGGLVVGTRIVRIDGSPINFQVAVVRALAAFLSAAAFMLGFFWAGWSPQKQSWHDIIAGTYVMKTRPSLQPTPVAAPANQ